MARQEIALESGVLLIAPPAMVDPNFRKSVVLLCEHTSAGSFGLILNHNVTVGMAELVADLSSYTDPVRVGGPVQLDTLHFLHRLGSQIGDAIEIFEGVFWGGNLEDLQSAFLENQASAQEVRFFLGYAGWGEGQLDEEVKAGGWLLTPPSIDLVFTSDPSTMWRESMLRMGGDYALLANYPADPILN